MISKFDGEYSFLSNFHPWGFTYKGGIYCPTAEHAYQAFKAKYPYDMLWVMDSATPGIAKRRGRKVELKPNWDSLRVQTMAEILLFKFSTRERAHMLKATTGRTLIEGNYWHDQFWGNCMCTEHADDPGKNYLGRLLMRIRNNLPIR